MDEFGFCVEEGKTLLVWASPASSLLFGKADSFIFTSRRLNVSQQRGPFINTQAASQGIRIKHLSQLKKPPRGFVGRDDLYSRNSLD